MKISIGSYILFSAGVLDSEIKTLDQTIIVFVDDGLAFAYVDFHVAKFPCLRISSFKYMLSSAPFRSEPPCPGTNPYVMSDTRVS